MYALILAMATIRIYDIFGYLKKFKEVTKLMLKRKLTDLHLKITVKTIFNITY